MLIYTLHILCVDYFGIFCKEMVEILEISFVTEPIILAEMLIFSYELVPAFILATKLFLVFFPEVHRHIVLNLFF